MAYPAYQSSASYGPGSVVEWNGRVYQLCLDSCYSRGPIDRNGNPDAGGVPFGPGQRWAYGNSWQDRGRVGAATVATKPAASTQTTWQIGRNYNAKDTVYVNGVKYAANRAITGINTQFSPASSSTNWGRV